MSDAAGLFDCVDATDSTLATEGDAKQILHHREVEALRDRHLTDTRQINTDSLRDAEQVESAVTCPPKDPKAATATDKPPPAALASTIQDDHDTDDEADEEEDEAERRAEHLREEDRSEPRRKSEQAIEKFSRRCNIARGIYRAAYQQFLAIPLHSARDEDSFAAQRASAEEAESQSKNHFAAWFAASGQEFDALCDASRRDRPARCAAIHGELDAQLAAIEVKRAAMRDRRNDEVKRLFREELDRRMERRRSDCPEDICE
ncbi:hypothetical protein B0A49_02330 [Cryomyces minteri]|uniref:Uncharacterized protein n=1 Tax=Cryomyces minteri TaxID=331657 RepID=A0A4U0XPD1_9PEZI|nr:hypothetical protein B0A49_02330 [Cryomyces minteri]